MMVMVSRDTWETVNGRDPDDGKLLFTFDCGGWQTEGWQAKADTTNIAGYQGFLDFDLLTGQASLQRNGLKLDVSKNNGSLVIRARSANDTELKVLANGKLVGKTRVPAGNHYNDYSLPLAKPNWNGTIKRLELHFSSQPGTTVGIDWIRIGD